MKSVGGNDQLCRLLFGYEGMDVSPEELRDFMSGDLTEFMIPAALVKLDKLPMNQNGKIDRKSLPVPDIEVSEEIVKPVTEMEKEISEVVAGVLGHDSFGVTTNLLKVGLTSLLAMRLVATIAKRRDVRITSKEAIADPTVRGLIKALESASAGSAPVKNAPKRKYYPDH
ncbi:MAG: phosphopantetheine-binding protein [Alistipes indistinctus]